MEYSARQPCISVVTVCYNAIATLPETFDSLDRQEYRDFEWVVVDGGSTDGTVAWLSQRQSKIVAFLSEADKGIYDAMNKAVSMAKGDWVFFLNADDRFIDAQVLKDVAFELRNAPGTVGIVYGDARYTNGSRVWPRSFAWVNSRNLVYGDLCHQVVFARRSLFRTVGPFDLTLRFNADFDWLLRVVQSGHQLRHVAREIVLFYKGGAHVQAADECERERFTVRHRYRHPLRWRMGNLALRVMLNFRLFRNKPI